MPRSIEQLKHREIHLVNPSSVQITEAARRLERMAGVAANPEPEKSSLTVHYWVDEYTLADLELALACSGFQLDSSNEEKHLRCKILREEEAEREMMAIPPRLSCKSCGVFALRYSPRKDDLDSLPFYH